MTARLKHKLELDNVNLKSAYLNESFVMVSLDCLSHSPVLAEPTFDDRSGRRYRLWRRRRRISSNTYLFGSRR